ncbi:ATP-binding protein [Aurantiacibacter poecillastricola]|uniref:ATP-binding protein n=1 Tax=Aurantiacibacter poecillastricola TaxID=3064385 RepID=UPI00273E52A8|nr:ATP-binding protein [Aurantiacibacter sp. 219JJ12-13]MDP5262397.1 CHASE3 domain-containing protein [Aurantiacibacter sp. 219JJ12-13]
MLPSRPVTPILRHGLLVLAFFLVPLSLLGVHFLLVDEFDEVGQYRVTAERTVETRNQLAQLLALHLDVETAVRGYTLTGDASFLGPYADAIPRRDAQFARLREGADSERLSQLDRLLALSDEKLAIAAQNVDDVRAGRGDDARQLIASGRGRRTMDAIRSLIAEIDAQEAAALSSLTVSGAASRRDVERSVSLLLVGIAVSLAIASLLIFTSTRQRREALEQVNRLAKRQKAMFDSAVDGMLWLDARGDILRMNPSISRMFGYTEAELVGRNNLVLMHTEYSQAESQAWLATVGTAGENGAGRRQEFTGRRSDGASFETEVAISRVASRLEAEGEPHYVASIRDISHRKRAERMKNEFVSTVSHELRTPLTSIGGSLGLVLGGAAGPLEEKTRRLIGIAHANCERLIRLINDILDIEKIESGRMEFDIRRMQVAPLLRRTEDAMAAFAQKHDVKLTVELPPWPQCIMGDPDRLEQLVTNLVSNAIKHSPAGETVEVVATTHRRFARIEVRDRGSGIPTEFRDRIFGKFAMADASDSRAKGGTGLGLSISREIARHHDGDIGYADREGGGTVFHVDIPLAREQAINVSTEADKSLPLVLHLDDDDDTLVVVASAFAGKAKVVSVGSIPDARSALADGEVAAAIIDLALGEEDGGEFAIELRNSMPRLPLVLFTAFDDTAETSMADRLLIKSRASVDDLVEATVSLIARRRKEAA